MSTVIRSSTHIVFNCHYHVVWCPKYRRKVLVKGIDERLKTLIQECVERWGQEFIQVEVMPDHVHLLVGCDPQFGIHRLVKFIKAATARQLREEFPHHRGRDLRRGEEIRRESERQIACPDGSESTNSGSTQ